MFLFCSHDPLGFTMTFKPHEPWALPLAAVVVKSPQVLWLNLDRFAYDRVAKCGKKRQAQQIHIDAIYFSSDH